MRRAINAQVYKNSHWYGGTNAKRKAGNILETSTVVKDVFIKGKKITAKSFFQKEFQRARDKISGETR